MRTATFLLGGLVIWAAHFFLLYAFASIFPETDLARILSLVATLPALVADAVLLWTAFSRRAGTSDEFDRWALSVAAAGAGLSFVAVLWQALPAVML